MSFEKALFAISGTGIFIWAKLIFQQKKKLIK